MPKEWWKLPSYKVFRVDTEYTETPSVRVTMYSLNQTAIEIYWLEAVYTVVRPCPNCQELGEADVRETTLTCPYCACLWEISQ